MSRIRTSLTDPLRIAEIRSERFPGIVGITFCPGKKQNDSWSGCWDRDLATDLDAIDQWGAATVISLIEDHEMEALKVTNLGTEIRARGIGWVHLPITDVSIPDHRFQSGWLTARGKVLDQLKSGGKVVVHCKGGLGRAGLVSARILNELGVQVDRAIELVREARPGAIETTEQEDYVKRCSGQDDPASDHKSEHLQQLLERTETELGAGYLEKVMVALLVSRAGLTDDEIRRLANLERSQWNHLRRNMGSTLKVSGERVLLEGDDIRSVISARYLSKETPNSGDEGTSRDLSRKRAAHATLARWFEMCWQRTGASIGFRIPLERVAEELPYQWREAKDWQSLYEVLVNREMFEAIYSHFGSSELLSYWLDLEREANIDMESAYADVWWNWVPDSDAEEAGDIADLLRTFLVKAGRYQKLTDNLARIALAAESSRYGPESEEVSIRLNDMAQLLLAQGKYDDAELLIRRALAITEKALGAEHPDTALRLGNLGSLLRIKGDFDAAEQLLRKSLEILDRELGSDHPTTGAIVDNLAELLRDKGEFAAAEPLYHRALATAQKQYGLEHGATSISLNNLASFLEERGDRDAAESMYRRALAVSEKVDGPEHPETGIRLNNLARVLQSKGDYENAERLFRRALAIAENSEGLEHPSTATSLNNLATLFQDKSDYQGAETLLRRALAISETVFGDEHPATATYLNNLAGVLRDMGKHDEGGVLQRRATAIAEKSLGPDHPNVGVYLVSLAEVLVQEEKYESALDLYRRALSIAENSSGAEGEDAMTVLVELGRVLIHLGQEDEGERCLARATEIATTLEFGGPFHSIAELRIGQSRYAEAKELLERCLVIRRKTLPPSHPRISEAAHKIVEIEEIIKGGTSG